MAQTGKRTKNDMSSDSEIATEIILTTQEQELSETWSLVLSAVQIPHRIIYREGLYYLLVPSGLELRAQYQIDSYFSENRDWPPKKEYTDAATSGIQPPTLLLVASLALFYSVTGPWPRHSDWFIHGAGDSEAILEQGEWFRLVTALTLHADTVHLMGNCFLGGFLVHFFCRLQGTGLGLFSMLVAAITGNWINVSLRGPGHHFVGFSTAVFAVIGMLAMISYQGKKRESRLHFLMPFMAGAALLAMVGSSGERTDLGAHLFGLISGLFIGRILCLKPLQQIRSSFSLQTAFFFLSGFILYLSWKLALVDI